MSTSTKRPRLSDAEATTLIEEQSDSIRSMASSTAFDPLGAASAALTPMTALDSPDGSTDKSKPASPTEEVVSPQIIDSTTWQGWAELENDPTIFSVLLQEWGVEGVQVREIVPLDAIFDSPAASTYGLIFLSRYIALEQTTEAEPLPPDLWFANQTSPFSCATVALMNIINNRRDIRLGEQLEQFKSSTAIQSSKCRGLALDGFDHVRNAHNSFAAEVDIMTVDFRLKQDAQNAAKKKRAQAASKGKRKKRRKKSKVIEEDDENGFHFIAYVPACGRIWKMDGLERQPQNLGAIEDDSNWLNMVIPDLQMQWESAAQNELEFSLLSLVSSQGADTEKDRAQDLEKATRLREDWGPLIAGLLRMHAEKGTLEDHLWK